MTATALRTLAASRVAMNRPLKLTSHSLLMLLFVFACESRQEPRAPQTAATAPSPHPASSSSIARTPAEVVEEFGRRMKNVSILAPGDQAAAAIRRNYAGLVEPDLLSRWTASPGTAPGRRVSSPWPDRIEVQRTSTPQKGSAVVEGLVVEVTSAGESDRLPAEITLRQHDSTWLIHRFSEQSETPSPGITSDQTSAVQVVRDYYAAIASRDFERAYRYWGESGPPNQSLKDFAEGFRQTASVEVTTGTPSRVEPAAGSRYVTVPVRVVATLKSGARQHFRGSYTLRRSVVDGATESQRSWHLDRAALHTTGGS